MRAKNGGQSSGEKVLPPERCCRPCRGACSRWIQNKSRDPKVRGGLLRRRSGEGRSMQNSLPAPAIKSAAAQPRPGALRFAVAGVPLGCRLFYRLFYRLGLLGHNHASPGKPLEFGRHCGRRFEKHRVLAQMLSQACRVSIQSLADSSLFPQPVSTTAPHKARFPSPHQYQSLPPFA